MSGLDKIVAEIENEAKNEAARIVSEANEKADKMLLQARAAADEKAQEIKNACDAEIAEIVRARQSAIVLQKRQKTLLKKQEILRATLKKAQDALQTLAVNEYFDLIIKLAAAMAENGEGEIILSAEDKARLPKDFEASLAKALPKGSLLAISKTSRDLNGGFVLKYGNIEQNGSFASILSARNDEFQDLIAGFLFA